MNLGERIKIIRENTGMSQAALAREAAISNDYMNKIEKGRVTNVGIEVLLSIVRVLKISIKDLIPDGSHNKETHVILRESQSPYNVGKEEKTLLEKWGLLGAEEQKHIKAIIDAMPKKKSRGSKKLAESRSHHKKLASG